MIYLILLFYVCIARVYFCEWQSFFSLDKHKDNNSENRWISLLILWLATLLWPIIVPFAYLELLKFHKKHRQVISLLINLPETQVIDLEQRANRLNTSSVTPTPNAPIYGFYFQEED